MEKAITDRDISRYFARKLLPITVATGVVISIIFPATYCALETMKKRDEAAMYAQRFAEKLREMVVEAPDLWTYQTYKYADIVADLPTVAEVTSLEVYDETGTPVTEYWQKRHIPLPYSLAPSPSGSAPLLFNNRQIGTVRVTVSPEKAVKGTVLLILIAGAAGLSLAWTAYLFPVRIVRMMQGRIFSLIDELQESLGKVKTLQGLLPICASCKNIRDDGGYWSQIEHYLSQHADVDFTHGICPECMEKLYPEVFHHMEENKRKETNEGAESLPE